jgi:hypothetical protein
LVSLQPDLEETITRGNFRELKLLQLLTELDLVLPDFASTPWELTLVLGRKIDDSNDKDDAIKDTPFPLLSSMIFA